MKINRTFGETIRELRAGKNLTLQEVAIELGIGPSMLSKIEKNNRKPSINLITKIARFYNVSNKELTIAYLSDTVVLQVVKEEEIAYDVLRVAKKKITHSRKI